MRKTRKQPEDSPPPVEAAQRRFGLTTNAAWVVALLLALLALVFYAAPTDTGSLMLEARELDLNAWLKEHRRPRDKDIFSLELTRTAKSSLSVVQIGGKKREPLHRHLRHDLFVKVLRGEGKLVLGARELRMIPGDAALVPAGVAHAFINTGKGRAAALALFTPPYDGKDMILVKDRP